MAFLVCYWRRPLEEWNEDHKESYEDKAIYLDQQFYELIYRCCRDSYDVLREIAELKYKSPTLVIGGERLAILEQELTRLFNSGARHLQIPEFEEVCAKAANCACFLAISGDMYPELSKQNPRPWWKFW